jgi:hypothetical protein
VSLRYFRAPLQQQKTEQIQSEISRRRKVEVETEKKK